MSYSAFQTLADAYLAKETSPTHNPPNVLTTAPELVKLAFTYDFTAKIARLSKQNVGHITGLGNRYLQERFEYKQVRITPAHLPYDFKCKKNRSTYLFNIIFTFVGVYGIPAV